MPRTLRIEHEGAVDYVLNRGDRREDIFREDQDREIFLAALADACRKTGWPVHAEARRARRRCAEVPRLR